jgi:hypothetical protein
MSSERAMHPTGGAIIRRVMETPSILPTLYGLGFAIRLRPDGFYNYVSMVFNPKYVTIGSKSLSSCNRGNW